MGFTNQRGDNTIHRRHISSGDTEGVLYYHVWILAGEDEPLTDAPTHGLEDLPGLFFDPNNIFLNLRRAIGRFKRGSESKCVGGKSSTGGLSERLSVEPYDGDPRKSVTVCQLFASIIVQSRGCSLGTPILDHSLGNIELNPGARSRD